MTSFPHRQDGGGRRLDGLDRTGPRDPGPQPRWRDGRGDGAGAAGWLRGWAGPVLAFAAAALFCVLHCGAGG